MDNEIITKRLEYIKEKLNDLKYDLDKYEKVEDERDKKTIQGAIERWSEEIVESAVMINNEILSLKNKVPDSYYNSFIELKNFGIFDKEFVYRIASTAGYRNRLAHDYMNVDTEISITSAKNILDLYKIYIKKVYDFIEGKK